MLKRAISDSRRLSELKTDSARLLWTWILPYLDVEGKYHADPDLIKGKIVPRLKTFTPKNINEYLEDMAGVGLVVLYEHDGDKYLQFRNFQEFQNLRENREGKSKIPNPPPPCHNSGSAPGVIPQNISKDKISKVNKSMANAAFVLPSKEEIQEASDPLIEENIQKVSKTLYDENIFPEVHAFKNKMLKQKKNLRSILHTLTRIYLKKEFKDGPWAYGLEIIKLEDLNYNERDYQKTAR